MNSLIAALGALWLIGCGEEKKTSPRTRPKTLDLKERLEAHFALTDFGPMPDWSFFAPALEITDPEIRGMVTEATGAVWHRLDEVRASMEEAAQAGHRKLFDGSVPLLLAGLRFLAQGDVPRARAILTHSVPRRLTKDPKWAYYADWKKEVCEEMVQEPRACGEIVLELLIAHPMLLHTCPWPQGVCKALINDIQAIETKGRDAALVEALRWSYRTHVKAARKIIYEPPSTERDKEIWDLEDKVDVSIHFGHVN